MHKTFSITEAIKYGWSKLSKNILVFLVMYGILVGVRGCFLAVGALTGLIGLVPFLKLPMLGLRLAVDLASIGATLVVTAGMIKIYLKIYNNEKFEIIDCVKALYLNYKYAVNLLLAGLIYGVFFMILFFVFAAVMAVTMLAPYFTWDPKLWFGLKTMAEALPGNPALIAALFGIVIVFICINVFVAARVAFYSFFIVDKNADPIECFKKSFELISGNFWRIVGFWFTLFGLAIAGLLVCCVGIFAVIPVITMAQIYVYKKLLGEEPKNPDIG